MPADAVAQLAGPAPSRPVAAAIILTIPLAVVLYVVPWIDPLAPSPGRRSIRRIKDVPLIKAFYVAGCWLVLVPLAAVFAGRELDAPPGPQLRRSLAAAAGNPFYVCELLRHARADGRLRVVDGVTELDGDLMTGSFRDALVRRLDAMDAVVRNVLRVAALYGPTFDVRDLAALIGESTMALQDVLDDARRAGIVQSSNDGHLAFTHDLFREAVASGLPTSVRDALHRDIAQSLIDRQAPVQDVVPHLVIGARPSDAVAVDWLESAAAETATVDPIGAEQLLAEMRIVSMLLPEQAGEKGALQAARVSNKNERVVVTAPWSYEALDKACARLAGMMKPAPTH